MPFLPSPSRWHMQLGPSLPCMPLAVTPQQHLATRGLPILSRLLSIILRKRRPGNMVRPSHIRQAAHVPCASPLMFRLVLPLARSCQVCNMMMALPMPCAMGGRAHMNPVLSRSALRALFMNHVLAFPLSFVIVPCSDPWNAPFYQCFAGT